MPNKSEAQRKAMAVAAKGKSTLGIPKKVAKEFMKSDPGGALPKRAGDRNMTSKGKPRLSAQS